MNISIKLITSTIMVTILIVIVTAIIFSRFQLIEKFRLNTIEPNAKATTQIIVNNLLCKNPLMFNLLNNKSITQLYQDNKFLELIDNIKDLFTHLPILKTNIYSNQGIKLFSNNNIQINDLNHFDDNKLINLLSLRNILKKFNELFLNSTSDYASLTSRYIFDSYIEDQIKSKTLIVINVPIIFENKLQANLELFYDISQEWRNLVILQNCLIIVSILFFASFIMAFFINAARFESLIEKQHDINLELITAKDNALAESDAKSKFLANVSHELRTPLNAIIGFSEIIKGQSLGPLNNQQYLDYINDIYNSGSHLLSLINDILDYSKATAEKLKVESIEVDLGKILAAAIRLVTPRAKEAEVILIEEFPSELVIIKADPKRLKQAILNLLSNSVKFTPKNGKVTLKAWVDKSTSLVNIQVIDTGIGIADHNISKAMSTFGQVDNTLSRKYEGTGLGLPLTKKLVELMQGEFNLVSELGFGTIVTLSFPYNIN